MKLFRLEKGEYFTDTGRGTHTLHVNLDHVVKIEEEPDERVAKLLAGSFILVDGNQYTVVPEAFKRFMAAINSK
jgi:hypothetical protein